MLGYYVTTAVMFFIMSVLKTYDLVIYGDTFEAVSYTHLDVYKRQFVHKEIFQESGGLRRSDAGHSDIRYPCGGTGSLGIYEQDGRRYSHMCLDICVYGAFCRPYDEPAQQFVYILMVKEKIFQASADSPQSD